MGAIHDPTYTLKREIGRRPNLHIDSPHAQETVTNRTATKSDTIQLTRHCAWDTN